MKPGIRTSEFWLAVAVVVLGAVSSVYTNSDVGKMTGIIAAALVSAGYGFGRSMEKKAMADQGIPIIEPIVGYHDPDIQVVTPEEYDDGL